MRQVLAVALLVIAAATFTLTNGKTPELKTKKVKVYLVALNDKGKSGKKIGCDDSLVAVTRTINATSTPLKAAMQELLSIPREFNGQLGNYVFGPDLKVKSVSISKGTATIRFSGNISVAGVCDEPRITEQILATARQFPTVRRVKVFVGNQTLEEAIR